MALLFQLHSKSHAKELPGFMQDMEGMSQACSRLGVGACTKPCAIWVWGEPADCSRTIRYEDQEAMHLGEDWAYGHPWVILTHLPRKSRHPLGHQGGGLTGSQELRGSWAGECNHSTLEAGGNLTLTAGESGGDEGLSSKAQVATWQINC